MNKVLLSDKEIDKALREIKLEPATSINQLIESQSAYRKSITTAQVRKIIEDLRERAKGYLDRAIIEMEPELKRRNTAIKLVFQGVADTYESQLEKET